MRLVKLDELVLERLRLLLTEHASRVTTGPNPVENVAHACSPLSG